MFKKTETELILQLKKGSMKAFDEIYGLYARRLFAFCLKYTKSKENAEEIMEDTFVWLWNNRSTLEEAESVKPLLFLRAKHYLINAYRKVINSPVYEDYMDYLDHHNSTTADSQLEYDDFVRQLNQMLAKLPKTQQEIIRLSKLEMLNNQEIAERLNYSEQTVKNQLSMGLKQLRQLISNRTNIELPKVQRNFLKALKEAGKKVVFVNCSGSAIALTPETESCDAILQAWYPGQEGGEAVARVLFGEYNPAGKLPITFYRNSNQLPDFKDYSMKGRTYRYMNDALFPFGYGLSYTSFRIGDATLSNSILKKGEKITLKVPVSNVGKKDGTEVVQVYVKDPADTEGPLKSLKAFERVEVKAGKTAEAVITLDSRNFELFDAATNTVRAKAGKYEVYYGSSSADKDLKKLDVSIEY